MPLISSPIDRPLHVAFVPHAPPLPDCKTIGSQSPTGHGLPRIGGARYARGIIAEGANYCYRSGCGKLLYRTEGAGVVGLEMVVYQVPWAILPMITCHRSLENFEKFRGLG